MKKKSLTNNNLFKIAESIHLDLKKYIHTNSAKSMQNTTPDILMLGWEFPPIINGGLGVACHDLSSSLSEIANVTMIVPKSDPNYKLKKLNLIGLNNQTISNSKRIDLYDFDIPYEYHEIAADLYPYYYAEKKNQSNYRSIYEERKDETFSINQLYGNDIIKNVIKFAHLSNEIAVNKDFDVIHAHDWMTMIAGLSIKRKTGKPLVVHIHSLEVDRSGYNSKGWVYEMEKKTMEQADLIIPVSHFTASNIEKYYGIDKRKMCVVHNGSKPAKAFKSNINYDEKTVLFVGRLTRQKGPELFVEIAKKVLSQTDNVRFVMAGEGDYYTSVIDKFSSFKLGNRFHMTGFLNKKQLNYLFSFTDVYCMTSVSEPFGLSAVEAAQFNVPCVISKQSGVAEVLKSALKFDCWDTDKAANYILSLLQYPKLYHKITSDASGDLNSISWDNSANEIINAYKKFNLI